MIQEYGDSDHVPIFDRLFLGGPRTVRAFKYRKVGPKDDTRRAASAAVRRPIGTLEYTVPVVDKVRLAAFYDVGVVWQDIFKEDTENPPWAMASSATATAWACASTSRSSRSSSTTPGRSVPTTYIGDGGRFSFSIGYTY